MRIGHLHTIAALALVCTTAATAATRPVPLAKPAGGQSQGALVCTYTPLATSGVQTCTVTPQDYTFTPEANYWTAVGVRSSGTDDWDLRFYDVTAAEPACVGTIRSGSTATTGVDFVVGDYNHSPMTQEYVEVNRFSGTQNGTIERDAGPDQLLVNGSVTTRDSDANDVLEVWDVSLNFNITYTIEFFSSAGNCRALLFRNPADSPYWASRGARVLELTSGSATYTAPATDWYGIVVVNEDGGSSFYSLRVRGCVDALALTSGSVYATVAPTTSFSFTQPAPANYWSAVGVRSPVTDWDLFAYGAIGPGPFPNCFTNPLALSNSSGVVDFVVGDFNVNPRTTYYVDANQYSGEVSYGDVEWDDGQNRIEPNDSVTRNTGPTDVLEAWDISMLAGEEYTIELVPTGAAALSWHLFSNPGVNPYWARRSMAVRSSTGAATWTPAQNGFLGVVVVNDNGAVGSYTLKVGACTDLIPLSSGGGTTVTGATDYYSFTQMSSFWSAVGVRQQGGDWDIDVWGNISGTAWPTCFGNQLANSLGTGTVDFVVGDFNHASMGTYYVRPYRDTGTASGRIEWDSGGDELEVNEPFISRTTGSGDVLEIWDAFLTQGVSYDLYFARGGSAATKLMVFYNNGATYWAPRSSRVLETTSTYTSFTAPATDWYGIVVVNDNGLAGSYQLGIASSVSDAGGGTPEVTALQRVGPNPSKGAVGIGFDLREPASVGIQVVDVAGRVVASLPQRDWPAGHWTTSWDGSDRAGRRVAAGVYYVRVHAAGREIGQRSVVLLP